MRELLADADPEIRAQAAKTLGDARDREAADALIALLEDDTARVRFFATEALGRIAAPAAVGPIARMLAANDDADVYLRTAGFHALAGIGDTGALTALAGHDSAAVRIAAVVALRRLTDPGVAAFLNDPDPLVVTEAARAINDEGGIVPALPALAGALEAPIRNEAFLRRALSANLRVGDSAAAARVGDFAADTGQGLAMRREAIDALGVWPDPSTMDRVDGAWLGQLGPRDATGAMRAVEALLPLLDAAATDTGIKLALLGTSAALDLDAAAPYALRRLERDTAAPVRIAALTALRGFGGPSTERAVTIALEDGDPAVRMAAIEAMPVTPVPPSVRIAELTGVINSPELSTGERQSAIAALGAIDAPAATAALATLLDRLLAGEIPAAIELDLLAAADAEDDPALLARLEALGVGPELAGVADNRPAALERGGSAENGRRLVFGHPAAQCTRCHAIGDNETTVGPPLDGIGARLSRAELLESLVAPAATLASGFDDAATGASAMPPMSPILTPDEIRDIVEFLATGT